MTLRWALVAVVAACLLVGAGLVGYRIGDSSTALSGSWISASGKDAYWLKWAANGSEVSGLFISTIRTPPGCDNPDNVVIARYPFTGTASSGNLTLMAASEHSATSLLMSNLESTYVGTTTPTSISILGLGKFRTGTERDYLKLAVSLGVDKVKDPGGALEC